MPWFKVDDNLALHPKVLKAGNAAMGLWVRAGAWSSSQLTDGYIPAEIITVLGGKRADATKLVNAGLWEQTGDGYQFHDWLERNPSAETVRQGRDAMTGGATLGNHKRWHIGRGITDMNCPHCRSKPGTNQSPTRSGT